MCLPDNMWRKVFFFLRDPVNRTNVCNILCSLYWTVSEGCSPNVAAYLLCLSAVVRYIKVKKEGQRKKKTEKNTLAATRRDLLTFSLRIKRALICLVLGSCIVPRLCLDRVCIVPSPRIWGCPLVDAAMVTSSTCHILHKVYRCTKLKWYFAIPNQMFKHWPNVA